MWNHGTALWLDYRISEHTRSFLTRAPQVPTGASVFYSAPCVCNPTVNAFPDDRAGVQVSRVSASGGGVRPKHGCPRTPTGVRPRDGCDPSGKGLQRIHRCTGRRFRTSVGQGPTLKILEHWGGGREVVSSTRIRCVLVGSGLS